MVAYSKEKHLVTRTHYEPELRQSLKYLHSDLAIRSVEADPYWDQTGQIIPADAIHEVVSYLDQRFPDGKVQIESYSYAGIGTILQNAAGDWVRGQPATCFPLLKKVSEVGRVSPFLSQQWSQAKARMKQSGSVSRCWNLQLKNHPDY